MTPGRSTLKSEGLGSYVDIGVSTLTGTGGGAIPLAESSASSVTLTSMYR